MTSLYGYDDAYRPTLDQLAAGDPTAVAVYLTGIYAVPSTWPGQIRARGWAPVANYEEAAGQLVDCWESGGVTIGATALAAALRDQAIFGTCTCGRDGSKPCRSAIYYSIDENVPQLAFGAVGLAFDGINQSHGSKACAHAYCEGALGEYLLSTKRICSYWLSSSSSYPGFNPQAPGCSMYQIYGSSPVPGTDQNIITHPAALHGFWPDDSPYGPGGFLMALTDQQQSDMYDKVEWLYNELKDGIAPGQTSVGGTIVAAATGAQSDFNEAAKVDADVKSGAAADATALAALAAQVASGSIDVTTLAQNVATALGPDLATSFAAAMVAHTKITLDSQ